MPKKIKIILEDGTLMNAERVDYGDTPRSKAFSAYAKFTHKSDNSFRKLDGSAIASKNNKGVVEIYLNGTHIRNALPDNDLGIETLTTIYNNQILIDQAVKLDQEKDPV